MADKPPINFEERIRRCASRLRQDQLTALGALYDLTAERLMRFALLLTRNSADAEDVIQASLLRVARRPECLSEADSPWAYFLRILRNESITLIRQRRPTAPLVDANQVSVWDAATVERSDSEELIRRAVSRLPQEQAEVIVLKIWEAMTFAQIAEVLGQSPNTVASRYRYAIQKLEQLLSPVSTEVFQS